MNLQFLSRLFPLAILAVQLALPSLPAAAEGANKPDLTKLPPPAAGSVDYRHDIQPILEKHCYACHGAKKQKSGLRLDRKSDALLGGDGGKVIIPGKSAESILIQNVAGLDPDTVMPPEDEDDKLTAEEVGKLRAWIDSGAVWPDDPPSTVAREVNHWAFRAPQRPTLPAVKDTRWGRSAVDAFVLARLENEKVSPSPEADRPTLLRRLSLDLTGLIPTPSEVNAFVADARSDAYERQVVRLLASPHFGERWARHWLDLARYADSDGYEKDSPRPFAYLFRDWVIDAINRDMPFDQFTVEQLAGDLLPNPTEQQLIATGFHRQTLTNKEGGVDKEEFRTKATVDRVSTTGSVWLGLTVGCAECHTHKFDPITQREFYQMYAFFNNASEKDVPAPRPSELDEYTRKMQGWEPKFKELKAGLKARATSLGDTAVREWEESLTLPTARWTMLRPTKVVLAVGDDETTVTPAKDGTFAARRETTSGRISIEAATNLKRVTGFRVEALDEIGRAIGRGKKGDFALAEFVVATRSREGEPKKLEIAAARADFAAAKGAATNAIDGERDTAWSIAPQTDRPHVIIFELKVPVDVTPGMTFHLELDFPGSLINSLRLGITSSPGPLEPATIPDAILAILRASREKRTPEQTSELAQYFVENADDAGRKIRAELAVHQEKKPKSPATTAAILTADERKTHVHIRGDFLRPGDAVDPGVLGVLHALRPRGAKPDRLDLAHWLVDPANPLMARVQVNHTWKHLFGRPLVGTVNDFGTRGDQPTHPELLDWLALQFSAPVSQNGFGWSRKALIKSIVTSATYRQASHTRRELEQRDPLNQWLARQNRFRLEAETVRDIYLSAAGLLNPKIGGPSIRPPLPPDIAALAYANSMKWEQSSGGDQYRRGLYIFFQRTVPFPMLMTFDAPDSNTSCAGRERSNTPLQALTLLNDPVFFECSQALGLRVAKEPASSDEKIRQAFRICLSRDPSEAEMQRLDQLHRGHVEQLNARRDDAARIAGQEKSESTEVVEKAALVALCRVIMNLDEFVTRE